MDGKVTIDDYAFTDAGFFGGGDNWLLGDYNFDGVVTLDDYAFQDAGFFGQGAPFTPSFADGGAGVVPEPSSLGLLAVTMVGLLNRRRR
jgi:hypothetical protein